MVTFSRMHKDKKPVGPDKFDKEEALVRLKQDFKERSFKMKEEQAEAQHLRNVKELQLMMRIIESGGEWLLKKRRGQG